MSTAIDFNEILWQNDIQTTYSSVLFESVHENKLLLVSRQMQQQQAYKKIASIPQQ